MCPWKVPSLDFPQKLKNQLLQLVITAVDVSMSTITTGQPSAKCEMNSVLLKANKNIGRVYALQTADISNYRSNSDRVWWISHGHDFYFIFLLLLFLFFVCFFFFVVENTHQTPDNLLFSKWIYLRLRLPQRNFYDW